MNEAVLEYNILLHYDGGYAIALDRTHHKRRVGRLRHSYHQHTVVWEQMKITCKSSGTYVEVNSNWFTDPLMEYIVSSVPDLSVWFGSSWHTTVSLRITPTYTDFCCRPHKL